MQLNTFSFDHLPIRIVMDEEGNPLWVAKDVAEALGYTWQPNLTSAIPEDWKGIKPINTPGGIQDMIVITEQGLYFFLNRSDKPGALPLQRWIAGEVLPSIRKTGQYGMAKVPQSLSEALRFAADLEDQRQALACKVQEQESAIRVLEPKAKGLDRIAQETEGALCMTDAAKVLQIGPKWLMERLCHHNWIYKRTNKSDWTAYQDKIDAGLLEHKMTKVPASDQLSMKVIPQVMVTKKGIAKIAKMLSLKVEA
jgi:prophage antirepressor-like protein